MKASFLKSFGTAGLAFLLSTGADLFARIPIEQAQREFQTKAMVVYGGVRWPASGKSCGMSTPAPAYPRDGFYGDLTQDPTLGMELVKDLGQKLDDNFFLGRFIKNPDTLAGKENLEIYTAADLPADPDDVTKENFEVILDQYLDFIRTLTHIQQETQHVGPNGELHTTPRGGSPYCKVYYLGPETAFEQAREDFNASTENLCGSRNNLIGVLERTYRPDPSSCDAVLRTHRGKVKIDLSKWPTGTTAKIYAKTHEPANWGYALPYAGPTYEWQPKLIYKGASNNPPTTYKKWTQIGSATAPSTYLSPLYGGATPTFTLTADDFLYYDHEKAQVPMVLKGWNLSSVAVLKPVWAVPEGDDAPASSCDSCEKGRFSMGSIRIKPGSAYGGGFNFSVTLGTQTAESSAGYFVVSASEPSASLATPSTLKGFFADSVEEVKFYPTGVAELAQVRSKETLADIKIESPFKYEVRLYHSDGTEQKVNGRYEPKGALYKTITVSNPANSTSNVSRLQITEKSADGNPVTSEVNFKTDKSVEVSLAGGLRREIRSSAGIVGGREETFTVFNQDGTVAHSEKTTLVPAPWGGEMVTKTILDPSGFAKTTTYTYYTSAGENGYGQVKSTVHSDGAWEEYTYDAQGRQTKLKQGFLDGAPGSADSLSRVTTTSYSDTAPHITTVETLLGKEISRRYTVITDAERKDIQAGAPGATYTDSRNLVTTTKYNTSGTFKGDVKSVLAPDGTFTLYSYATSGGITTTTIRQGAPNGDFSSVSSGTRTVQVEDSLGREISTHTYDINSGHLTSSSQVIERDSQGRATRIKYHDGSEDVRKYGCCGLEAAVDRNGNASSYSYDALKRLNVTKQNGLTIINALDAMGRTTSTTRQGIDGSSSLVAKQEYYPTGSIKASENALGHRTSYSELVVSGHLERTTTLPDGTTSIEIYYRDGSLKSTGGTAVRVRQTYEFGVDTAGFFEKVSTLGTSEWVMTHTDFLGRHKKTTTSGGAVSEKFYNSKGQLEKEVDPDQIVTLFFYNTRGELEDQAIDINQNDTIDRMGPDRVLKTANSVNSSRGTQVHRTTTLVYGTPGEETLTTLSTSEQSVDGLNHWQTAFGLTTQQQTVRLSNNALRTIGTAPDGTKVTRNFKHGRLVSFLREHPSVGVLESVEIKYDAKGRQDSVTDVRTGVVTQMIYDDADRPIASETNGPEGLRRTQFQYDSNGRRTKMIHPDGGVVNYEYFPTGELKKSSGARTYTQEFSFEDGGRIKTLKAGAGITTWNYEPLTGFLTSKIYPDGKGTTYEYYLSGRLKKKTSARNISATYTYNKAGDLEFVNYSDTTPDVKYFYDRQGRQERVQLTRAGKLETTSYALHASGVPLRETFTGGPLNGIYTTNRYDSLLRRTTFSVYTNATSALSSIKYAYDGAGRLTGVTNGTLSAQYSYKPQSSLLDKTIFRSGTTTRLTTAREYDSINRLTSINNDVALAGEQDFDFAYQFTRADQRNKVTLADGSYWEYKYDSLGQVISGKKFFADGSPVEGQSFEYGFDSIGNRTSEKRNGKAERTSTYTPNNLNQITSRTVPGFADFYGTAHIDSTVTVNKETAARKKDYFYRELAVTNANTAIFLPANITGVLNNSGAAGEDRLRSESGSVYVPKTPEVFKHDFDGNLTEDGRWKYTWDAENRLRSIEAISVAPPLAKRKLEFLYDHIGRRIQKKIYTWNAVSSAYTLAETINCLYDGWNLAAELTPAGTLIRNYTWGQDLSGSLHGAGGVGGLLMMKHGPSNSNHFYAFDGNGNVMGLVNAADGKISATYEYGPFGQGLKAVGSMSEENTVQFSTKLRDSETDMLYYGERYFSLKTGTWLSREPLGESESANLYLGISNDFINGWDFLGMQRQAVKTLATNQTYFGYRRGTVTQKVRDLIGLPSGDFSKQPDYWKVSKWFTKFSKAIYQRPRRQPAKLTSPGHKEPGKTVVRLNRPYTQSEFLRNANVDQLANSSHSTSRSPLDKWGSNFANASEEPEKEVKPGWVPPDREWKPSIPDVKTLRKTEGRLGGLGIMETATSFSKAMNQPYPVLEFTGDNKCGNWHLSAPAHHGAPFETLGEFQGRHLLRNAFEDLALPAPANL
jgi:RHS repeat-associated protein